MSKFVSEFKEFIARGNVMDMAVGILVGGAFTAIVTALTTNILTPIITFITGGVGANTSALAIKLSDSATIDFGAFISAIINFLLIALVVFCLVKALNTFKDAITKEKDEEEAVTTKTCPFCKETIDIDATRCPHCTSVLEPAE